MSDITITIHGGNNQILPNATEAIQNFYVGEYRGETSQEEEDGRSDLMGEAVRFRAYINKEEDLERLFLPITPRITKGKSVSNIRARINDAWSSRLRHRSTGRF